MARRTTASPPRRTHAWPSRAVDRKACDPDRPDSMVTVVTRSPVKIVRRVGSRRNRHVSNDKVWGTGMECLPPQLSEDAPADPV